LKLLKQVVNFQTLYRFIEIDALIDAIDLSTKEGERNRAMLETLYGCIRVSELVALKFQIYSLKKDL
jgi:site-specific recombinase XerD